MDIIDILILIAVAAVAITLGLGLYNMQRMQAGLRPDGAAGLCRICIIHEPFYFPHV